MCNTGADALARATKNCLRSPGHASRRFFCNSSLKRRRPCVRPLHLTDAHDSSDDYIYGPSTTPVEEVSLSSSTPTYMTYTPSDSSWLIANAAGDETAFYGYDAFGNLAFGIPTSLFGYAGQYTDASTGLSNMRARWYGPQTGEFATRDPAFASTDSAYTYTGDDPVNASDPTGDCVPWLPCGPKGHKSGGKKRSKVPELSNHHTDSDIVN